MQYGIDPTSQIIDRLTEVARGRTPLDAQVAAARLLAEGHGVIAVLPTGSGKTMLATLPFAAGLMEQRQMIYMTPLRTLTSAQAYAVREGIDPQAASKFLEESWAVTEQSGSTPGDPEFLSPACVTTFDQALSSALHISYSVGTRRRSINAGAVLSAYLVADEVHLFPRTQALTTLLWLLRERPRIPFLLVTATLTRHFAERLAELLGAVLLPSLTPDDRTRLGVDRRERRLRWVETALDVQLILKHHASESQKTLVVVNTVRKAINLARDLEPLLGRKRITVLHSRYYEAHRRDAEERIHRELGRESPSQSAGTVVIATQVVEAGLDISADVLITELAPANALVQRWGRCARWGGRGELLVADATDDRGRVLPYSVEPGMGDVLERTRSWLAMHASGSEGIHMDESAEQDLLDAAHRVDDELWLNGIGQRLRERSVRIGQAVSQGDYTAAGELIRHVDTRTLLVHGDPAQITDPTQWVGFGVSRGSLFSLLGDATGAAAEQPDDEDWLNLDLAVAVPWKLQRPVWPAGESPEGQRGVERWETITTGSELLTAPILSVHPAFVRYDPWLGLELAGGEPVPRQFWATPMGAPAHTEQSARGRRRSEGLDEHVGRALAVYENHPSLHKRLIAVADRFENWLAWPSGLLVRLARAAIVCHDLGKLSAGWAREARRYQLRAARANGMHRWQEKRWLAHTDNPPPGVHIPWRPPPHALSGAVHSRALGRALDEEVRAYCALHRHDTPFGLVRPSAVLFSAVATHHAPSLRDYALTEAELLEEAGLAEARRILEAFGFSGQVGRGEPGRPYDALAVRQLSLERPQAVRETVALALITRVLRLADAWSQESTL